MASVVRPSSRPVQGLPRLGWHKPGERKIAGILTWTPTAKHSRGMSPQWRVERAKMMMTSTKEQLTVIALACGFSDHRI